MKYRTLGRTGWKVSEVGFGGWAIGGSWGAQSEQDSLGALRAALDLGVNFIDTAASYGGGRSEKLIAQALKGRRDKVYVATKTPPAPGDWPPTPYDRAEDRYGEAYLRQNVEERLRNLATDCIDVLQLHTWTRAWNRDPKPLETLRKLQKEGKVRHFGLSTPEQDPNCVVELMKAGWLDVVQVVYNIFDQEPAAELLPAARECNVGIIVRVPFDEGSLTGKFTRDTQFAADDFRARYFAGDRLARTVDRAEKVRADLATARSSYTLPQAALKFVLAHPAVSTTIPGIRSVAQAQANCGASDLPDMPEVLHAKLRKHNWLRGVWYGGK